jgi:zinc transport system ATP-binding protein
MGNPVIRVENVSKVAAGQELLRDVSFTINEQELVSLIGPNGAGKTTLVKILLGLDTRHTGSSSIRSGERVQYIPQLTVTDRHQLPMSVREYLQVGTTPLYRGGSSKTVSLGDALTHVGVSAHALNQSFTSLSGGERQRVAIARALLSEPTMLVLDEPLAAVDYASRQGLYELIRHLQKDHSMTVLLVSHDIQSVIPISDRVLCLNVALHTDCHPSSLVTNNGDVAMAIHHTC